MHHFRYVQGRLQAENVDLETLADRHGTPLYVYSKATVADHFTRLDGAMNRLDHLVCYAVKANSNLAILHTIAELGGGFDIVSAGELYRVLRAGGKAANCTFAGVGKTRAEIEYALKEGIYCFNAESEAEVRYIDKVAGELGKKAPIALRVNPNVDAKTHAKITTGKSENKFGIEFDVVLDVYERIARECPNLEIKGIQMHIGSQLTSIDPFLEAVKKVVPLVQEVKKRHGIKFFSIGGGIGIVYKQSLDSGNESWWQDQGAEAPLSVKAYADALVPHLETLGLRILLEPGRFMVGNAGVLLTRVLYEKKGTAKTFKIVDAGMNDLIRPTLYEGWHQIVPTHAPAANAPAELCDVVGPICETGDFLAQNRELPPVKEGDLLAVLSAGAYGFTMASNYNTRPLVAEVLVDGAKAHVVRDRQTLEDVLHGEHLPTA